jgi:hypothetical protein
LIAKIGRKDKAILLAGVSVLAFVPLSQSHVVQPVAFDQFFWTWILFFD